MEFKDLIKSIFLESISVKEESLKSLIGEIERVSEIVIKALKEGNKILVCGNGGSASDAQHFVGELICTFENRDRKSLPAISLTTNTSIITAYANDFSFDEIFSRQIEGLGTEGDVLVGLTTSGNSKNVLKAFETAKSQGIKTVCFCGGGGGEVRSLELDSNIIVPSDLTARIQETHITIIHTICSLIEREFA